MFSPYGNLNFSQASLTKRTYEPETETHWDMIEKDLPVYTYALDSFAGSATKDYQVALGAHVSKKNSRIRLVDFIDTILYIITYKIMYGTCIASTITLIYAWSNIEKKSLIFFN